MGPVTGNNRVANPGTTVTRDIPGRRCSHLMMPLFVAIVVVAEIAFLERPDMVKKAALVDSWADSFDGPSFDKYSIPAKAANAVSLNAEGCRSWLEREDAVFHIRDFDKDPIVVGVSKDAQVWNSCSVGCKFVLDPVGKPDAAFGRLQEPGVSGVLRSMESSHYFGENNIANARRMGFSVVMTTSLSSDVPVGYFSWTEYEIMAPLVPKTETSLAAAFISNCGSHNFRLQALEDLEKNDITIDSYGACHRTHSGRVNKVETLKKYKFSLAFENSNEEDYVTEKFFQSLVAGTIPVVIGAPNIQDFAPSPGSVLHIKHLKDVSSVAETMRYLSNNSDAFNEALRWKHDGPSDSFKALLDMSAVHSSCRLCIFLATRIHEYEERNSLRKQRPCKCSRGDDETVYHVYVRERGRYMMQSVFLRSNNMTVTALEDAVLEKFKGMKHIPVWKQERPLSIRGDDEELRVYRIYPLGLTQRQALYTFRFQGDADFSKYILRNPCPKFEVIFV